MPTPKEEKKINVEQVARYLNHAFADATDRMGKATRTYIKKTNTVEMTELYKLQVEFTYMLDNIRRGPTYLVSKVISDCNRLIANINTGK